MHDRLLSGFEDAGLRGSRIALGDGLGNAGPEL